LSTKTPRAYHRGRRPTQGKKNGEYLQVDVAMKLKEKALRSKGSKDRVKTGRIQHPLGQRGKKKNNESSRKEGT